MNFANYAGLKNINDIVGKTDYDMPWSREEADFFRKIDQEVMTSGIAQLNFEEPQTLSDGSKRWISTSKVPLYDENKKIVGILGWYIDITPYKSMQIQIDEKNKALLEYSQRLEKSRNQLKQANSDLEMFTYAVSHDLKSPIRTIVSFSDLILTKYDGEIDSEMIKMLNFVNNSGKNMGKLVQNILSYARSGLSELNAEKVKIKNLVEEKVKDLDQLILNEKANINLDFPDILISCYPELLGMVFYNLISNGLKYNKSDSPNVKCTMENTSSELIFSIKDNGIGINPKFNETIFQPFKRLNSPQVEGTGLGLSICKRIIELHMGKIWINSDNEIGTNFKFSISKNLK